ncbi:hypothetical protein ACFL1M_02795 [Patescibacteria group bacterium]
MRSILGKSILLPAVILFFGLLIRVIYPTQSTFHFDQEQVATNAMKIISGKPVLIGPKIGPAQFFLPPLYYYLAAPYFFLMNGHPTSLFFLSGTISLLTGFTIYYLFSTYKSKKSGLLALFLWATSYTLIKLDRVGWNVNLMLLSSLLVYFGLSNVKNRKGALLTSLGLALSMHAHFSGLVLYLFSLYWFFKTKTSVKKSMLIFLPSVVFSLLPLVLFDLRHDFVNISGIKCFFTESSVSSGSSLLFRMYRSVKMTVLNFGDLILDRVSELLLVVVGLIMLTVKKKLLIKNKSFILAWILSFTVIFGVYDGHSPEYYFLMQFPAFFEIISSYWKSKLAVFVIVLVGIVNYSNNFIEVSSQYYETLKNKIDLISEIKSNFDEKDYFVNLTLPAGKEYGFTYLFEYYNVKSDSGDIEVKVFEDDTKGKIGPYYFESI